MSSQVIHGDAHGHDHGHDDHHHDSGQMTVLGFWLYLMSDCLIFAVLFAVYAVLGGNFAAGPAPKDLFDLKLVALNTAMLLFSSITYGFAMLTMEKNRVAVTLIWLAINAIVYGIDLRRAIKFALNDRMVVPGILQPSRIACDGDRQRPRADKRRPDPFPHPMPLPRLFTPQSQIGLRNQITSSGSAKDWPPAAPPSSS